jgi:hypothetical protein
VVSAQCSVLRRFRVCVNLFYPVIPVPPVVKILTFWYRAECLKASPTRRPTNKVSTINSPPAK